DAEGVDQAVAVADHHQRERHGGTRTLRLYLRQRLVHLVDVDGRLDVDVEVLDAGRVDDLLVRGRQRVDAGAARLQVRRHRPAERDLHIATGRLDGVDVVEDARVVEGNRAAPGRYAARGGTQRERQR